MAATTPNRCRRTFSSCPESASRSLMARSGRCASGDLLHCPAGTEHIFVGAGDRPCAVLMIGSRREDGCHYAVNDTAAKYGASVTQETDDPAAAYADWRAEGPDSPSHEPMAARVTRTETKRDEATMKASEVPRAVAAGMSTASALGLTVDDAVVLHDSNRLAVRLLPCDVLARVAHVAHQAGAEFEVEVARRLAETDSPVAELEPRVEPRVYVRDGFVVTLWTYYEPVPPRDVAPRRVRAGARAAARRHAADRCDCAALHGSSRGGAVAGWQPRPDSGARRRGSGASHQHVAKPEARDRRPRRRRAAAARRAAPGQLAQRRRKGCCL